VKFAPVAAAAAALALVVADRASAGSRVAYFTGSLVASQGVSWEQHTTSPTCDGGSADIEGSGTSALRLRTPRPQPAVARRVRGALGGALSFGKRDAGLPVVGTITRKDVNHATRVTPGKRPPCQATRNPTAARLRHEPYPREPRPLGRVLHAGKLAVRLGFDAAHQLDGCTARRRGASSRRSSGAVQA
jgi:hypothetical protein